MESDIKSSIMHELIYL